MKTETIQIKASGMMCSFCTMSVESALKRYPGVKSVLVNLVHGVILVEADPAQTSRETLASAVDGLGYPVSATESQQHAKNLAFYKMVRWRGALGMALSVLVLLVDSFNIFGLPAFPRTVFSFLVAAFILVWVGSPVLKRTWSAVKSRVINANVLLSAAAWGALVVGGLSLIDPRWPNFLPVSAWLMSLHIFSNSFKMGTNLKAAEAVRSLLSLQPPRACVLRGGQPVEVALEYVSKGETVLVKPGERIPLDGEVSKGIASVDESSFTGESVPVAKEPGAAVIGGTLNLDGALEVVVTKVGEESFLSQLVKLMSQVSDRKVPLELLADRIMNYYGPVVLAIATSAFFAWLLATRDPVQASVVFVSALIMGYPCALGITTPMLAAIAGGKGISIGLLVKSSEVFQQLSRVDTAVFDKTGTLTYGRPTVTDVIPFGVADEQLLAWASAVECRSEHPLGRAVAFYGESVGVTPQAAEDFRATPGLGVAGTVDGAEMLIGNLKFLKQHEVQISADVESRLDALAAEGKTGIVAARERQIVGVFALQDTPRRGIQTLFQKLRAKGVRTVLLTGDAAPVADSIATTLGIDETRAQLLPAEKVSEIEALQQAGRRVAMVGDGINDGPALLQADVGVAVGAGTDVAIESAGVILMGDRINDVAGALTLGKAAYRTMQVNVAVAVLFNIVGLGLAAVGMITPVFAVGFMLVSIFGILLNTLRVRWIDLEHDADLDQTGVSLAETEFAIPSMVCEGCAEKISATLSPLDGVRGVESKVRQKRVRVRYEPDRVGERELRGALEEAGYNAVEV